MGLNKKSVDRLRRVVRREERNVFTSGQSVPIQTYPFRLPLDQGSSNWLVAKATTTITARSTTTLGTGTIQFQTTSTGTLSAGTTQSVYNLKSCVVNPNNYVLVAKINGQYHVIENLETC